MSAATATPPPTEAPAAPSPAASPAPKEVPAPSESPVNGSAPSPAPTASQPVVNGASGAAPNPNAAPNPSASLYVGELELSVTEAMLFELFNMVGPVASIRVCRDAVTRRSLGYAYVNFHNATDGERALETLNYTAIKGRPCRIMWSQRDPALRKTGTGNIFIKNLDLSIDNKALHDTFSAFGNILSCKVAVDENGTSKGYGFVHYETAEAAENAITHVNGMLLNDKKVYVGHHVPRKERQSKVEELKARFTNVYVKNLDLEMDDDQFNEMFSKYGPVTSAVVSRDEDGVSKGFGFVNFEEHEHAVAAVEDLHDQEIDGRKLFVTRAQKKHEREEELRRQYEQAKFEKLSKYQGVNLYIKNLDDDVDDERLRQEFAVFGTITSAKVMRDEKNVTKGFGFVCYASPDEATKAVTEMNGRMLGNKPLYVALAQRKDVRRSQLEAQMQQRQLRMQQQAVAAGMPQGYMPGAPMFYPPPGAFPGPQGQRGMVPFPPQGFMGRPRFPPGGQPQQMGMPGPYGPGGPGQQYNGMPMSRPPRQPRQGGPGGPRGGGPPMNGRPPMGQPGAMGAGPRGAGVPARGGYKYGQAPRPQVEDVPAPGGGLTAATLASAAPEDQKQMLGEAMYPKIFELQPQLAGKITGMLLEMDNSELLNLLEDESALGAKVDEALSVLKDYQDKEEAPEQGTEEEKQE